MYTFPHHRQMGAEVNKAKSIIFTFYISLRTRKFSLWNSLCIDWRLDDAVLSNSAAEAHTLYCNRAGHLARLHEQVGNRSFRIPPFYNFVRFL